MASVFSCDWCRRMSNTRSESPVKTGDLYLRGCEHNELNSVFDSVLVLFTVCIVIKLKCLLSLKLKYVADHFRKTRHLFLFTFLCCCF